MAVDHGVGGTVLRSRRARTVADHDELDGVGRRVHRPLEVHEADGGDGAERDPGFCSCEQDGDRVLTRDLLRFWKMRST
jgi:hypothetical protein